MCGTIVGTLPPTVGLTRQYFEERQISIDCRGTLQIDPDTGKLAELIIDRNANLAREVLIMTGSHDLSTGKFGDQIGKSVIIKRGAFIGSRAVLYNCTIGENAVVAAGSVVLSMTVPDSTMVAGNPAKIVAVFLAGKWRKIDNG
jgi:acetyltransferase-like isoleucine patch superfamily enzyme